MRAPATTQSHENNNSGEAMDSRRIWVAERIIMATVIAIALAALVGSFALVFWLPWEANAAVFGLPIVWASATIIWDEHKQARK